jgi:hypothetical protein
MKATSQSGAGIRDIGPRSTAEVDEIAVVGCPAFCSAGSSMAAPWAAWPRGSSEPFGIRIGCVGNRVAGFVLPTRLPAAEDGRSLPVPRPGRPRVPIGITSATSKVACSDLGDGTRTDQSVGTPPPR